MDAEKQTDLLYRDLEFYRNTLNTYSFSTFDDVKYIGAVIAVILIPTLLDRLLDPGVNSIILAFGFFASIDLSLLWLEQRNCLKLSIIRFYMSCIAKVESEIQSINEGEPSAMMLAANWKIWSREKHQLITQDVLKTFEFILLVVPIGHLLFLGFSPLFALWEVVPPCRAVSTESILHALIVGEVAIGAVVVYWCLHQWKGGKLRSSMEI